VTRRIQRHGIARASSEARGDLDPAASPRGAIARVALVVLLIKAYSFGVLYSVFTQTPVTPEYGSFLLLEEGQSRKQRLDEAQTSFLERLAPYDGQFYLDIAANGYRTFDPGLRSDRGKQAAKQGNHAFFPLFPFLLRALGAPDGRPGLLLAVAVNGIFATAAGVGVWLLARRLAVPAWSALLLMLSFPTAIFQNAIYTESLFLFLSVCGALCVLYRKWAGASVLGYLGGLCRPQGILLALMAPAPWASEGPRGATGAGGEAWRGLSSSSARRRSGSPPSRGSSIVRWARRSVS